MDKNDVLIRAKDILENGPLPKDHSEHGEYCPYCAIALAKGQLDEEQGTGVGMSDVLVQLSAGVVIEFSGDEPLIEAREALDAEDIPTPFTKEEVLKGITKAIN